MALQASKQGFQALLDLEKLKGIFTPGFLGALKGTELR